MNGTGLTLALIARIPHDGIGAFQAYESAVLPLLGDHGGVLQRRLAQSDNTIEIHLVWFPSAEHFARFRADPRRGQHASVLQSSGAVIELIEVGDMAVDLA